MSSFRVHYTSHALDVLKERNLGREIIESVVRSPEWKEPVSGEVWCAFRRIGRKVLRVVIRGNSTPFTVVTAYYDRRKT